MLPEEAIQVADELLFAHAGNPLTDIQRMILRESLADKGYESMKGYAPQHIKNEGKKLWDLLSEALGEKVSKTNFKGALEKRLKSGGMVPKSPQPSNYDERTWAGRETAVSILLPKLQGQTQVLWLTGISGIGKTALGECLASQAWKNDPSFQWIYVEILEGQSKDFASVAADLLAKVGDRDLDPQERNNPEQLAKRLLRKLQAHPYWMQLDALERLLDPEQPTEFMDGYWTIFLQRCLTESNLVSRLVLTAQALPDALVEFSDRYPNTWTEIRLSGLSEVNQRLEFFTKRGVIVEEPNREILTRIAATYEGHPLVLKVIVEDILKECAGDVLHYWQVNQREFEQIARELQDARLDETEYNEALDRKVRERIKKSLEQLPVDALDLLCRSSVFRRPVPKTFWLAMISDLSIQQQKAAYRVLDDRALIEKEGVYQGQLIRQHNLIRDITYNLLRADIRTWESVESQAANLWLTIYEPTPNASKLESVRGYLEAFNHFCELKDLDRIKPILRTRLATFTEENLLGQLGTWGYYNEQVKIYTSLLAICPKTEQRADRLREAAICGNLGNAYSELGKYEQAIEYHQRDLEIVQELKTLKGESTALGNLGADYQALGKYQKAIDYYQQQLKIAREEIKDLHEEGRVLNNLGTVYYELGAYNKAIEYHEKRLKISKEIQDIKWQGNSLGNLGNCWCALGDYTKAIDCHEQALRISKQLGYKLSEGQDLVNLGVAQTRAEKYVKAIDNLQNGLKIFQEISSRSPEADALYYLAELHHKMEQDDLALEHCDKALEIATELGIPLIEDCRQLKEKLMKKGRGEN